ncbi:hypothetical protein [Litoribacter populi]|uniref:hypothetical protein n=1 Tax=Litoribacter populi TaxID=2598460 RepID=UPI001180E1DB|nr:hypothetical protein [Litoribacter populi]
MDKFLIKFSVLSLFVFCLGLYPSSVKGQGTVICEYLGTIYGCEVYKCGDCFMAGCGTDGGALSCPDPDPDPNDPGTGN